MSEYWLVRYLSGERVRLATEEEIAAAETAAALGGGLGIIEVDGESVYVDEFRPNGTLVR